MDSGYHGTKSERTATMTVTQIYIFLKEQFYFFTTVTVHQLNYSNIDTFININKQNQK